jgi:hypothetical protein
LITSGIWKGFPKTLQPSRAARSSSCYYGMRDITLPAQSGTYTIRVKLSDASCQRGRL